MASFRYHPSLDSCFSSQYELLMRVMNINDGKSCRRVIIYYCYCRSFFDEKGIYLRQDFDKCHSLVRFLATMNDSLMRQDDLWRKELFDTFANECITNMLYTLRATLHPNEKFISSSREKTWDGGCRWVMYSFQ